MFCSSKFTIKRVKGQAGVRKIFIIPTSDKILMKRMYFFKIPINQYGKDKKSQDKKMYKRFEQTLHMKRTSNRLINIGELARLHQLSAKCKLIMTEIFKKDNKVYNKNK